MISIVVIPITKENSNTSIIRKLVGCLYFAVRKSVFIIIRNTRIASDNKRTWKKFNFKWYPTQKKEVKGNLCNFLCCICYFLKVLRVFTVR